MKVCSATAFEFAGMGKLVFPRKLSVKVPPAALQVTYLIVRIGSFGDQG